MIRIEGEYELADYKQVVALRERRTWLPRIPTLIAGGLTLFLVAAAIVFSTGIGGSRNVELSFVIWLVLLALWRFGIRPLQLSWEFDRLRRLYAPFVCEVTEEGVSFQSEFISERIHWHAVAQWRETTRQFVLDCVVGPSFTTRHPSRFPYLLSFSYAYYSVLRYRLLPKRLFEDEAAIIHFRELLVANHISRKGVTSRVLAIIAANSLDVGVVVAIIVGVIALALRR